MLLVVQNDPRVPLGTYADYLAEAGAPFRTIRPYAGEALPNPAGIGAVIVLGGAMGVNDVAKYPFLDGVKDFIADTVACKVPLLGICLGGQLLAHVLGAPVVCNSPWGEKGTLPVTLTVPGSADPLFREIDRRFMTFQWHNDSFAIPNGGELLASSSTCPNQAFRFGANATAPSFTPKSTVRSSKTGAVGPPKPWHAAEIFLLILLPVLLPIMQPPTACF
ncbi:type 1 glutamine amidotransferase [Geotalea toluenoxydans]|uniref:type 1 glutamine amidotransferase n=1 Tax=Geotalea toluenoxydans TaxID=421624 RepID=UPI001FB44938|nr:type 1 glutamine amidotransferase [Geotalea toluenoxydans]